MEAIKKWYAGFSRRMYVISIIIIVALVLYAAYQVYLLFGDKVGNTATGAIQTYFTAIASGDYDKVYQMTARDSLTDIYGRRITQGEFFDQLKKMTGEHPLPFSSIEVAKLFERRGVSYYLVTLHSVVGDMPGESQVMVQLRRVDNVWVIVYPFIIML